jgi:hypothetical protein
MGPRVGLDAVEYRKISCPCRESNPGRPVRSLSLSRLPGFKDDGFPHFIMNQCRYCTKYRYPKGGGSVSAEIPVNTSQRRRIHLRDVTRASAICGYAKNNATADNKICTCDVSCRHTSDCGAVTGLRLDNRGIGVPFLAEKTASRPAPYPMGNRGSFPGGKSARAWS